MNKSNHFSGQPIFSQVISLIPRYQIRQLAKTFKTDYYYKKFKTYEHLITMLYAVYSKCNSIREVTTGLLASGGKLNHLGMGYFPRKSTLSDANGKRNAEVFEAIYGLLYKKLAKYLPDSRKKKKLSKLYIFDSTTISLFQEILKSAGKNPVNGKRKGGIKAHTLIKADEDVPKFVRFTASAANDSPFMKKVNLPEGSIVVFDKGYNDYKIYQQWTQQKISFVTRLKKTASCRIEKQRKVSEKQRSKGVLKDENILLGHHSHDNVTRVKTRIVTYYDTDSGKTFQFLTNNFRLAPSSIADIYEKRWQIESLFKRIKQNYPLKYFLGDNQNAIKIQIWTALIADLLLKYLRRQVKRKWAFSNLVSMIRLHSMNYIHLYSFLEDPDKAIRAVHKQKHDFALPLFPT